MPSPPPNRVITAPNHVITAPPNRVITGLGPVTHDFPALKPHKLWTGAEPG